MYKNTLVTKGKMEVSESPYTLFEIRNGISIVCLLKMYRYISFNVQYLVLEISSFLEIPEILIIN